MMHFSQIKLQCDAILRPKIPLKMRNPKNKFEREKMKNLISNRNRGMQLLHHYITGCPSLLESPYNF